jgi:hypothetical protein
VEQEIRALEVGEKLVSEADAFARPLDQTRHVRNRELPCSVRRVDRAEHGCERRERIVGDLGPRIRDPRQQRGLTGIRQPDERRVGEQLEPEIERRLLAGQTGLGKAGCATRRRSEALVPPARNSPARSDHARCGRRQVGDQLPVLVQDLRPDGNGQFDRLAGCSVLQGASAGLTVARAEAAFRAERGQVAEVGSRNEDDIPAGPAVTAVRPTFRNVLLPAEVQAAVAAATRLHVDAGAVVKHPRLVRGAVDFDESALAALLEGDRTGARGEDRVVAANAGACARTEPRPSLTHKNHPGLDLLTGEDLDSEHFRVRVATVAR